MSATAAPPAVQSAAEPDWQEQRHRSLVDVLFRNRAIRGGAFPDGFDPFEQGLVLTFVRGGASDPGRLHLASCSSVRSAANRASHRDRGRQFAETDAWHGWSSRHTGFPDRSLGCSRCGTEPGVFPVPGAAWKDETAEQVAARHKALVDADAASAVKRQAEQDQAAENSRRGQPLATVAAMEDELGRTLTAAEIDRVRDAMPEWMREIAQALDLSYSGT